MFDKFIVPDNRLVFISNIDDVTIKMSLILK